MNEKFPGIKFSLAAQQNKEMRGKISLGKRERELKLLNINQNCPVLL
jgi:hypothetical protein